MPQYKDVDWRKMFFPEGWPASVDAVDEAMNPSSSEEVNETYLTILRYVLAKHVRALLRADDLPNGDELERGLIASCQKAGVPYPPISDDKFMEQFSEFLLEYVATRMRKRSEEISELDRKNWKFLREREEASNDLVQLKSVQRSLQATSEI